jgi:hypothetical protein
MPAPLPPRNQPTGERPARRVAPHERKIIAALVLTLAAIVIITVVSLGSSSPQSRNGCIHVSVPGPIGATFFDGCGSTARQICGDLHPSSGLNAYGVSLIARACRRAEIPVHP